MEATGDVCMCVSVYACVSLSVQCVPLVVDGEEKAVRKASSSAPCGLLGCKNRPDRFPGRMSYKATKPGLAVCHILGRIRFSETGSGLKPKPVSVSQL